MSVERAYIGLGANLGRRPLQLKAAIDFLGREPGVMVVGRSRVYETPALLPPGAPHWWDIDFLNQVIAVDTRLDPLALLDVLKRCEQALGRQERDRWGPREIDCDLLLYGDMALDHERLQLPHAQLCVRDFVLVPLAELAPEVIVRGRSVRDWRDALPIVQVRLYRPAPVRLMGIVNMTPDSFSHTQARASVAAHIARLVDEGADIIDIGGESTRPGARPLSPDEEWARIGGQLHAVRSRGDWLLSVDTYHPETARLAIGHGADWINDVSGARDARMLEVVAGSDATYVAMHSLSVPVDPTLVLPEHVDPVEVIVAWAAGMLARTEQAGIPGERVVLDPGLGFGKTALQSLEVLVRVDEIIRRVPQVRWLVGHSRKSFMRLFSDVPAYERDAMTLAFSSLLLDAGVDYLRVHEVCLHKALVERWSAWA